MSPYRLALVYLRRQACAFVLITLISIAATHAQHHDSSLRSKQLPMVGDTLTFDTAATVPGSLILRNTQGHLIPDSGYHINYAHSILIAPTLKGQHLTLTYRAYPFSLSRTYYHKRHQDVLTGDTILNLAPRFYQPTSRYAASTIGIFSSSGLEHSGSLMRGINVSTNSNASLVSEMNLQLTGQLASDVYINASISDNNLPALPEGNTASLQEFDRIFISIYNAHHKLTAGDIDLVNNTGFFDQHQRKILGLEMASTLAPAGNTLTPSVAAGVTRGKFARQTLAVSEGNQGPYTLTGVQGEQNIVVLSGSERVYIDGRPATRSQDGDYTMDYATGQISFTPRIPITGHTRIIIEFEYTEQSYTRYLVRSNNRFECATVQAYINAFYEGDARHQPVGITVGPEQQESMANAGVNIWDAYTYTADSIGYSANEVLYARTDTLTQGQHHTIYVHSTNPATAHFRLRFAYVGRGMGSYVIKQSAVNGRIYQWTGPGTGEYEPRIQLTTPRQKVLLTSGATYRPDSLAALGIDLALSHNNINLFTHDPRAAFTGVAVGSQAHKQWVRNQHTLSTRGAMMVYSLGFESIERFTSTEYERDWNIEGGLQHRSLQEYQLGIGYQHSSMVNTKISAAVLQLGHTDSVYHPLGTAYLAMQGLRLDGTLQTHTGSLATNSYASYLTTEQHLRHTRFVRAGSELAHTWHQFTTGVRLDIEHNTEQGDTGLLPASQKFYQTAAFTRLSLATEQQVELSLRNRQDYLPTNTRLEHYSTSHDIGLHALLKPIQSLRWISMITYRHLRYIHPTTPDSTTEQLLLGRQELHGHWAKQAISSSLTYELGSGMDMKQNFIYVDVGAGQGVYTWVDYNNNGIKELNEFEVAVFQDEASYIRVALPSREYIRSYTGQLAFQFSLRPALYFDPHSLISRFSNTFSFANKQKSLTNNLARYTTVFTYPPITDSTLVNINYSLFNNLSFATHQMRLKIDLNWQEHRGKQLLINGIESRHNWQLSPGAHYKVNPYVRLNTGIDWGQKLLLSEFDIENKSFDISYHSLKLGALVYPEQHVTLGANYQYINKNNTMGYERSSMHEAKAEATYNFVKKGFVSLNTGYAHTAYNANPNTPVGYEMLQAYGIGHNITWGGTLKRLLNGGIEVNFTYTGRKLPLHPIVHAGTVELRLLF